MAARTPFRVVFDNQIGSGLTINDAPIIPAGQAWTLRRVIFGDQNIGDNLSGGFRIEFGNGGSLEVVTLAWLTGDTKEIIVNRQFEGDGVNRFRLTRFNNSASAKFMFVIAEGFRRL